MSETSPPSSSLEASARQAVKEHPESDVEIAIAFCEKELPEFVGASNDRLVKVGRSLVSLLQLADSSNVGDSNEASAPFPLEESLALLLEECRLIVSDQEIKVPTVRFGKTELQMPIVTLGCMRFQQEWGPRITKLNQVGSDCQDNLVAILKTAIIKYGITHIETARGYGCSELQLGVALKQLFMTKQVKREDLIIQTKIPPYEDVGEFRKAVETSFRNLQVDYIDLFAFHGMNYDDQIPWTLGNGDDADQVTCMSVIQEYKKAGKIRHIGFSTHAPTDLILRLIKTDAFDYVNLHYHYFGSYTASGGGHDGNGNMDCVKLLKEKDMGIFIISPFDKGGRLYAPSRKLRKLTLPEMEPMTFKSFWIWNHHQLEMDGENGPMPQLHTYTVGAARPSDLDQPAIAAYWHATQQETTLSSVKRVTKRLDTEKERVLGKAWVATWWKGLPKSNASKYFVEHNQIVWIYNSIKAFGLYEFGKARYNSFEKNKAKWDDSLPPEKNIDNIGRNGWGFVPGLPLDPTINYDDDLANVPKENIDRVKEAEAFVYKWCRDKSPPEDTKKTKKELIRNVFRRNFSVSSQLFRVPSFLHSNSFDTDEFKDEEEESIPWEWETANDMRPWPDFPDRPSRGD